MSSGPIGAAGIPPVFDREFLEWFRQVTEERWRTYVPVDFMAAEGRHLGTDWQTGTRWKGGLSDQDVETAEQRYGLRFPSDYRLFLTTLHTPDRPMLGARYEGGILPTPGRVNTLVPWVRDGHTDWTGEPGLIEAAMAWAESVAVDIEANESWHASWGPRPNTQQERDSLVRQLIRSGPQLIPLGGHRYLVGPPDRIGNPVLSIYGEDVICYGKDLRSFLLVEHKLLSWSDELVSVGERIPFWQDVIDGLPWPG